MERPNEYKIEYVAVQDVPYQAPDPAKGTHAGQGLCHEGRVVWLAKEIPASTSESELTAWVEGAGIVTLKPRFLRLVDEDSNHDAGDLSVEQTPEVCQC